MNYVHVTRDMLKTVMSTYGELYTFLSVFSYMILIMLGQIQDSIAQTQRRQSEALGKKRTSARATAAAFARRSIFL